MRSAPKSHASALKSGLHPRNRHSRGYDFPDLVRSCPELARFVRPSPAGSDTIDFSDPAAVLALNRALLKREYGVEHWEIPPGYLCPPIPGRADYIHSLADLIHRVADGSTTPASAVRILDIGVGANCVYPILGVTEYGWHFVGADTDPVAITWARQNVAANRKLVGKVELRLQTSSRDIFRGVINPGETFAASMCNPPFHASRAEAAAGSHRKMRNLQGSRAAHPVLNFGGQSNELWCEGGEAGFVRRMIKQSAKQPKTCGWFTTLVSKRESLPAIYRTLRDVHAVDVRTLDLAQGQKQSRIVAWRFP